MKKIALFAILSLFPTTAFGQKWGLEKCIDYALENNIQVKQSLLNVEAKKLGEEQAKFSYLPSLNASAGYNLSFGRSRDETSYRIIDNKTVNSINGSVSLGAQLFAGMSKLYTLEKSKLDLLAAIEDVQLLKNDISVAVAASYLQILYFKEQIATTQNQIEVLSEQVERTKKLVKAGSVAFGTQLELESQLAAEKYNLVNQQNNHATNLLTLAQLLELKDIDNFEIEIPDVSKIISTPVISDIDQINEMAQDLPQIKGSEIRLQMSEKDVKLAQSKYYPTLSLGASYGSNYSDASMRTVLDANGKPMVDNSGNLIYEKYPFFDQFADHTSTAIQLSLQIPIFNGLNVRRGVSLARIGVRNSDHSLQLAKNKLYKDIQQAHNDALGALNRYQSAMVNVKSTEETFHYAEQKFVAGAANPVDYTTAKNNLLSAQSRMLQAKYEYVFRVKILDFYKGIPITL